MGMVFLRCRDCGDEYASWQKSDIERLKRERLEFLRYCWLERKVLIEKFSKNKWHSAERYRPLVDQITGQIDLEYDNNIWQTDFFIPAPRTEEEDYDL